MNPADALLLFPSARAAFNLLALTLLYLFAFRPLLRWVTSLEARPARRRLPNSYEGGAVPGITAVALGSRTSLPPAELTPEQRELDDARHIYNEVCEYVATNPEKTADLLRTWMKERP